MKSWYLYYRLLYGLDDNHAYMARIELQDVLIACRTQAAADLCWSDQQTQDFFESLVTWTNNTGIAMTPNMVYSAIEKERVRMSLYPEPE